MEINGIENTPYGKRDTTDKKEIAWILRDGKKIKGFFLICFFSPLMRKKWVLLWNAELRGG